MVPVGLRRVAGSRVAPGLSFGEKSVGTKDREETSFWRPWTRVLSGHGEPEQQGVGLGKAQSWEPDKQELAGSK